MGKTLQRPRSLLASFERKPGNEKETTHYCPGCGHGRIHKLIAEALENLAITDKTIFISPVGCSVFGYYYFDTGNIQAAHGRAPAVATGVARSNPESIVISYQGDGDLAAIGMAEILHAANRGENITVIFVNNSIYGMTGGQMAPTSLSGQKTITSPYGRNIEDVGHPIRVCEIIASLTAPVYVERVAVSDSKNIMKAKRAIEKALKVQKEKKGLSFVEILSACPTGWKVCPVDGVKYINEVLIPQFPLGVFKDETNQRPAKNLAAAQPTPEKISQVLELRDRPPLFPPGTIVKASFPLQKLRIVGHGGQGVLMMGTTLAHLGMELGLEVTWLPSYGPEMRGGTANCHVIISPVAIGSPGVDRPNVVIAMNGPGLVSFEPILESGGLLIINSSVAQERPLRTDIRSYLLPLSQIAEEAGEMKATNMAALAAYLILSGIFPIEKLQQLLVAKFKKPQLLAQNLRVIDHTLNFLTREGLVHAPC